MKLSKLRIYKRRLPDRYSEHVAQPNSRNGTRSMDFMHDTMRY